MRALVVGLTLSLIASAAVTPAAAQHSGSSTASTVSTKPDACAKWGYSASSSVVGVTWTLRQKADGGAWEGPWSVVFNTNGTWSENGQVDGSWCQSGDMVIFGFSVDPQTTYRGTVMNRTMQGTYSRNGLDTGIFELSR